MPGILPMKVIRIPNSTTQRIAQACDRCRSKKIRCDGIRPCCTQCSNVGFECKTSDKLSRRAFPRGYTESLEDRVRGLEAEVRELKDLLDEKDEKIDMLSRIHNFSPASRKNSTSLSPANSAQIKAEVESVDEELFHVEAPAPGQPLQSSLGASSAAAFVDAFDGKLQEKGKEAPNIRPSAFTAQSRPSNLPPTGASNSPPRLLSDQYINIFFQEWQPLFPLLHRPSFLRVYEEYLRDPDTGLWQSNKQAVAQLYLIFDIAAISYLPQSKQLPASYEIHWRKALHSTGSTATVPTIQCHVLAQLYYLLRADYAHLARHRAIAVSLCHQLGLHQMHKIQSLPPLEAETRKKAFWCQYVLDKFTSAATGTPMLIQEADVTTEFPADVDDENLNAQGFSPALPGELTKISSALALFRVSKILAKTLQTLYPPKASYQVSLRKLRALSDELDQWSSDLPVHLRLQFCKDKPSTNTISDRSPLLSLAYFYIRGLIHRPLVCHGSGNAASASTLTLATAAKHVLQILELLDERRMDYTFPLNKSELLLFSGFSLLWQCLDLEEDSKLIKDNQKTLTSLLEMLTKDSPAASEEFYRLAGCIVKIPGRRPSAMAQAKGATDVENRNSNKMLAPSELKAKSSKKQLDPIASRSSPPTCNKAKGDATPRRATVPRTEPSMSNSAHPRPYSSTSLPSTRSTPILPLSHPAMNADLSQTRTVDLPHSINLDYFPIGEEVSRSAHNSSTTIPLKHNVSSLDTINDSSWEQLLTEFDNANIYSGLGGDYSQSSLSPQMCANGRYANKFLDNNTNHHNNPYKTANSYQGVFNNTLTPITSAEWTHHLTGSCADISSTSASNINNPWGSVPSLLDMSQLPHPPVPQSVLSFSEESLTSCEDLVFSAAGSSTGVMSESSMSAASNDGGCNDNNNNNSSLKGAATSVVINSHNGLSKRRQSHEREIVISSSHATKVRSQSAGAAAAAAATATARNNAMTMIKGITVPAHEDADDEFVDFT